MIQSPRGMSIMEAYELYRKDKLLVNRRYQRKLVWSLDEKKSLIESILLGFPIPLILLASTKDDQFEIIDGMQRLNAIFSFIENHFSIDLNDSYNMFFHIKDYPFAQTQVNTGVVTSAPEDNLFISQENVSQFIQYQLPVTIFKSSSEHEINETFRRLNSTGRKLSPQEVRQAGNLSNFSLLVKRISAEIRGDHSKNTLLLQQMPEISIDSKQLKHFYGIKAEDTFWCKHGVLNISDLRDSEDEQFIADIILSCILDAPFAASKDAFDNYYGSGKTDKSSEADFKLNQFGEDVIEKNLLYIFDEIAKMLDAPSFKDKRLKDILNPKAGGNPTKEAFYSLFMAFHELMIQENKSAFDYQNIRNSIENVHSKLTRSRNYTVSSDRQKNIDICIGLIRNYFKKNQTSQNNPIVFTSTLNTYLLQSKIESSHYDFKQGFFTLVDNNREFDKASFYKILCNISAMANLGKTTDRYIFIGITDKESDTKRIEKLDQLNDIPRVYDFGIVGLEREAKYKKSTLDDYISFITQKIDQSTLDPNLKSSILKNIKPVTYHGKTILMITIQNQEDAVYLDDKMYFRKGSSCKEIKGAEQRSIFKLFR